MPWNWAQRWIRRAEPREFTILAECLCHLLVEPAFAPDDISQAHGAVSWMVNWIWLLPWWDISREPLLSTHGQNKPFSLGKALVTTDISFCRHSSDTQHWDNVLICQREKSLIISWKAAGFYGAATREVFSLPAAREKTWPAHGLLICHCRLPALLILKAGSVTVTSEWWCYILACKREMF